MWSTRAAIARTWSASPTSASRTSFAGGSPNVFPKTAFGEESGSAGLKARCVWVIDPIDGTACFVNGLHNWCVSIGLLVDGEPHVGAIADPNHDELFHGCLGRGAYVNETPLRASTATHVCEG